MAISPLQHWWGCRVRCSRVRWQQGLCPTDAVPHWPTRRQVPATPVQIRCPQVLHVGSWIPPRRSCGTVPQGDRCRAEACLRSLEATGLTVMWGLASQTGLLSGDRPPHRHRSALVSDTGFHWLQLFARMLSTWLKLSQGDIISRRHCGGWISIWTTCCVLSHPANSHNSVCKH